MLWIPAKNVWYCTHRTTHILHMYNTSYNTHCYAITYLIAITHLSLSITCRYHSLVAITYLTLLIAITHLSLSLTCRYHSLLAITHFSLSLTSCYHSLVAITHLSLSLTCRYHSLVAITHSSSLSLTCRYHSLVAIRVDGHLHQCIGCLIVKVWVFESS